MYKIQNFNNLSKIAFKSNNPYAISALLNASLRTDKEHQSMLKDAIENNAIFHILKDNPSTEIPLDIDFQTITNPQTCHLLIRHFMTQQTSPENLIKQNIKTLIDNLDENTINIPDKDGNTLLHIIAGDKTLAKNYLSDIIDKKANPNIKNEQDQLPHKLASNKTIRKPIKNL